MSESALSVEDYTIGVLLAAQISLTQQAAYPAVLLLSQASRQLARGMAEGVKQIDAEAIPPEEMAHSTSDVVVTIAAACQAIADNGQDPQRIYRIFIDELLQQGVLK